MKVHRKHWLNIALVAVAVAMAAVTLWDRNTISTEEAEGRKLQLFDAWRPNDLAGVTIASSDLAIELGREKDESGELGWSMREKGETIPCDDQAVDDFLLSLEYAGFERRVEGQTAAALGLEPPKMTVTVAMGSLRYVLRVGGEVPAQAGARYAEVEGGARPTTRYVLKPELVKALEEEPRALRSKRIVPYLSGEVERYELAGEGGWVLARGSAGGRATADMVLEAKGLEKQRASWRVVDAWTTVLANLEARQFLAPESVASAPAGRLLRVTPRDPKKPAAELEIGGKCDGGTLIRRKKPDPVAACVSEKLAAEVPIEAARFVDRYALGLPESDVTEILLSDATTTVELARRGEGWHLRKPEEGQVDAAIGNALLERIAKAEGELVFGGDDKKLGLDAPRAHVRIIGAPDRAGGPAAKEHVEELDVGASDKEEVYLRRGDGAVLRMSAEVAAALLPAPSALRSTQVYEAALKDVRALELDCDGKKQKMTRDGKGGWTRIEPDTALAADLAACNQLAEAVRTLVAVRWAAEKPEPHHGLDNPWCAIAMTVADESDEHLLGSPEEKTHVLKLALGAETGGGYFARREGLGAVFVAPRVVGQMAKEWLLDRGALMIEPDEVDRVTIAAGERKLVIARRGDGWTLPGQTSPNDTRAESAGKALEGLLAEGVVALGPADKAHGLDEPRARIAIERRDGKPPIELAIGAGELWHDTKIAYVRKKGVDATFAVGQARLQPILDAP